MKREEKVAIVRILVDLIKADAIIDTAEMKNYAQLKAKYNLTKDDEIKGSQITLADAMVVMSQADEQLKKGFLDDCSEMTVSDGFCARSEALLMIALRSMLNDEVNEGTEIISILKPAFNIPASSVLYVESYFDEDVNQAIRTNYRLIFKECQLAGFNFIYIPTIIQHYNEADRNLTKDIISFLAPTFTDEGIETVIDELNKMTTSSFCKDTLCNKLGISVLRNTAPSLFIKIGHSYVDESIYANYVKYEIDGNLFASLQTFIDVFMSMLSTDYISVPTAEEKSNQFLYHGFYKQLLDIFLVRKNIRSRIHINPYKEDIYFPDIDRKLEKLHRREKALYVLFLILSKNGGINFNLPKSAKQLTAYNRKLSEIQKKYQIIYGYFGGGTAPDLSQAEIRRPIISCLKRSLSQLDGLLYNAEDYMIIKDEYGNLNVNLEDDLIYLYESESKSMIQIIDSELFKKTKR